MNQTEKTVTSYNPAFSFFLYLVWFLSLGFVATGAGSVLFQIINKNFPDILGGYYGGSFNQEAAVYGLAALIVAFPIFFIIGSLIHKAVYRGLVGLDSRVRRWLTYIVLFVAAAIVIGDCIALIFNVLQGDIVARFMLKCLVVFVIAGGIFLYYLWDMRRSDITYKTRVPLIVGCVISILLISLFVSAFFVIDSPAVAREKKLDTNAINALQSVDSAVQSYYYRHASLPQTLSEVKSDQLLPTALFGVDVSYEKTAKKQYRLCATFNRSSDTTTAVYISNGPFAEHGAGNVCFTRDVEDAPIIKQ